MCENVSYFSLARDTDISHETYAQNKIILALSGEVIVNDALLHDGECIITPANIPVGFRTSTGCVYAEIITEGGLNMKLNAGEIFSLAGLVPYQSGRIVNMDIVNNDAMKVVVMTFDEGTGLTEHAAPGDALIFEGVIGYEGKEHHIKAGENFMFAKNGRHYVKAKGKFKMALLLTTGE